ncbi:MAG TPA: hypothetical protein DCP28_07525, partial [Cytophagales bacterium]|nr:hypothetical protein [Cytophagales bacterium]
MNSTLTLVNPFPGLRAFEPQEADRFYGRDQQIADILEKLQTNRFIAVLGTSGSGKSSLVKGGVLPRLTTQEDSSWRILTLRPEDRPLQRLAEQLDSLDLLDLETEDSEPYILAQLKRSSLGLVNTIEEMELAHWERLLIVVDQFEEIFRFRKNERITRTDSSLASIFVDLLLQATRQRKLPVYVMLTMRSDFLGDCTEFEGLPEAINEGQYLIPRMTHDQLREVIVKPLKAFQIPFQQVLINRVMFDLDNQMDQLPILQHAMMRTMQVWLQETEGSAEKPPLSILHYEAAGTLRHALSDHANEAYQELDEYHQTVARRLFQALTVVEEDGRGVRRPQALAKLVEGLTWDPCSPDPATTEALEGYVNQQQDPLGMKPYQDLKHVGPLGEKNVPVQAIIQVLEVFRKPGRSFLLPSVGALTENSVLDISHESLMRVWDRLQAWLQAEAEGA